MFQRSGNSKKMILGIDVILPRHFVARTRSQNHLRNLRAAFRNRAGLIEHDRIDFLQPLQGLTAFDENSIRSSAPGRNHHCRRNGQPHRAWTSNHQNRNSSSEGLHNACTRSKKSPRPKCNDSNAQYRGHKDRTHAIGNTLDRRPRSLRIPQQSHNLRQRASCSQAACTISQRSVLIENLIPLRSLCRARPSPPATILP